MHGRLLLLTTACLLAGAISIDTCADQIYRWVDKDGHVHYSSTPPPTTAVHAEKMKVAVPQAAPTPAPQQGPTPQDPAQQGEAAPQQAPVTAPPPATNAAGQCVQLQQQMSDAGRDASLTEAQRLRKQRTLVQQMRSVCP
jgi:hypothetical protein